MMNGIKRAISLLAAGALGMFFSACALGGGDYLNTVGGDEPSHGSSKTVSLNVFTLFEEEEYHTLVDDFARQNPDIIIDQQVHSGGEDATQSLTLQLDSEDTPDIVFFYTGESAAQLVQEGLFVPVSEIRRDFSDYAGDILPAAIHSAAGTGAETGTYAVPVRGFYEGLFINTDLFDEYDVALPDTWDALLHAIDVFAAADILPVATSLSQTPHYLLDHLILAEGGAGDFGSLPANADEVRKSWYAAFDRLSVLYEHRAFGTEADTLSDAQATELFLTNRAAMRPDGSWLAARLAEEGRAESTAVLPFTGVPGGTLVGGFTSGYYITRSAWEDGFKREAAVRFVNAMTSRQSVDKLCGIQHLPAASVAAPENQSALWQSANRLCCAMDTIILPLDARIQGDVWGAITQDAIAIARGKASAHEVVSGAFAQS